MVAPGKLELRLKPDWDAVKAAWEDCRSLFRLQGFDDDTAYALSMAAQELLENAVKYGHFAQSGSDIQLVVTVRPKDVTIEVRNPVTPNSAALKDFDQTVQWIRGYQNPFEAYVQRLKEVSAQPFAPDRSGLGLTRVAYEAGCLLDFVVNEANELTVSAIYPR